ncbi:MAG: hypothetical protein AAB805_00910 [Patescibacteria group bacterium]
MFFSLLFFSLFVNIAEAAAYLRPTSISDVANTVVQIANSATKLFFAAAVVGFMWGAMRLALSGGNADQLDAGKTIVRYGIIALFIAASLWGIVRVVQGTLFGGGF